MLKKRIIGIPWKCLLNDELLSCRMLFKKVNLHATPHVPSVEVISV